MITLLASFLLGGSFLVAGSSKIVTREKWRSSVAAMGVSTRWVAVVARLVPPLEIVLGALIFVRYQPMIVGAIALGVLLAFTAQIALQLRRGHHPVCACFGAWSATPLGVGHLVRNAAFMVLAIAIIVTA